MDEDQRRQVEGLHQPFNPLTPPPGKGPLSGKLGCVLAFVVLLLVAIILYLLFLWGTPLVL